MENKFKYAIDQLSFSNGQEVDIEKDSLAIFVGPNSSGKSSALRDIRSIIERDGSRDKKVIKDLSSHKDGTEEGFKEWLDHNFPLRRINGADAYYIDKNIIQKDKVSLHFNSLDNITPFLLRSLYTEDRLQVASTKRRLDRNKGKPQEFIHMLQLNEGLKKEINSNIKLLFDKQLYINNGHDSSVWFHVGSLEEGFNDDLVAQNNLEKLNKLPKLEEEGDGIRSYVAALLSLECGSQPILMIDEPELFLHSVQCKKLGRLLAEKAKERERQIIIATHSSDIVKGALEAGTKVTICRIERSEDVNIPCVLNEFDINTYWSDPLLKSANAINGIFHEGVIVCEGEADCLFYDAILDKCEENKELPSPTDLYFLHGGGKGKFASLVQSYRKLNVKVAAIADFDVLRKSGELQKIYAGLGGEFSSISSKYDRAKSCLDGVPSLRDVSDMVSEAKNVLDEIETKGAVSVADKKRISNLLNNATKWSAQKRNGINSINDGVKKKDCVELLNDFSRMGFFICPEGELESWLKGEVPDKPWLEYALSKINENSNDVNPAKEFMKEVNSWFYSD